MIQLPWVQFFSWFALFAMWIYTTPAVTSHVYGTTDPSSALYNEGANWVGVGFGTYNGVAAVVAFAIPVLARRTSRKAAHDICWPRWWASASPGPASSPCPTRS